MPNFDGTGPEGKGPLTGRGLGNCKGSRKSQTNRPRRQGMGRGLRRSPNKE